MEKEKERVKNDGVTSLVPRVRDEKWRIGNTISETTRLSSKSSAHMVDGSIVF